MLSYLRNLLMIQMPLCYRGKQRHHNGETSAKTRKPTEDYCMAVALLTRERSKDPNTQVGACIVNEHNQIVSTGYNGMPIGCRDDDLSWGKDKTNRHQDKSSYVCHAEMNAIVNRTSTGYNLKGCTLYSTYSPCADCAKLIVQSGIKEVVYGRVYETDAAKTKELMTRADIHYRQYHHDNAQTVINIDLKNGKASFDPASPQLPDLPSLLPSDQGQPECEGARTRKRQVDLKWPDYHMAMALLSSLPLVELRSQDQDEGKGGACIVNEERRTVGTGSSSLPGNCTEDPWSCFQGEAEDKRRDPVCHAEMNAIVNRMIPSLRGCTMYTAVFPCNKCATLIVQSGISKLVYAREQTERTKEEEEISRKILDHAEVFYKKYNAWASASDRKKAVIVIDLAKAAEPDAVHMEYSL